MANETVDFKQRYQATPTDELKAIIESNSFRPEAVAAAQQILQDRGVYVPENHSPQSVPYQELRVVVTDIEMPILSMFMFMVKWSIASIPVALTLFVLTLLAMAIIGLRRS